jgi:hypothetical protein
MFASRAKGKRADRLVRDNWRDDRCAHLPLEGGGRPAPAGRVGVTAGQHTLRGLHPTPPRYRTASMTRPTLAKISPISASVTISGGVNAIVSPVMRTRSPSSWNAFSIAI